MPEKAEPLYQTATSPPKFARDRGLYSERRISCRNKETPKHADRPRPVIRPAAGRTITLKYCGRRGQQLVETVNSLARAKKPELRVRVPPTTVTHGDEPHGRVAGDQCHSFESRHVLGMSKERERDAAAVGPMVVSSNPSLACRRMRFNLKLHAGGARLVV